MFSDYASLFSMGNTLAMLGWALLILAPKRWNWILFVTGILIPAGLGLVYGGLMMVNFAGAEGAGYGSLAQVRAFMNYDPTLLAGWLHYLGFDLIVGTWIAREADKVGIVRIVQIPMLLATFLFGPVGFVMFIVTRAGWEAINRRQVLGAAS